MPTSATTARRDSSDRRSTSPIVLGACLGLFATFATVGNAAQVRYSECEVKGRLVVFDSTGAEQAEESGTAFISVLNDSTILGMPAEASDARRVSVIDGRFIFRIQTGERVRFDFLELDHGQARPLPNTASNAELLHRGPTFAPTSAEELVVRARYLPRVRVHLIDAEDHSELSGIDVIRESMRTAMEASVYVSPFSNPLSAYPPPFRSDDFRLRSSISPLNFQVDSELLFPFPRWRERLWCHAPGHCWTPIDVDYLIGGESTVALARSGSLRVQLTGPVPPVGARLVLKPPERSTLSNGTPSPRPLEGVVDESEPNLLDAWPVSAEEESRFDGLPPGDYRLELQAGLALGPRYLLGSVAVTLERGKETFVELAASPVPKTPTPSRIPVAIELHLDPGWTDEPFDLTIEPSAPWPSPDAVRISRPQLMPKGDDRDRWTTSGLSLAPGTWYLKINRFRVLRSFQIGAMTTSVALDVGPPVDVAFHLVDARSRDPVLVRKICWSVPARDVPGAAQLGQWSLTPRNHTLRARVPAGPIEISGENDELDWSEPVVVNVGATDQNVEVPLKRLIGIRVRFTLDDETVAWGKVYRGTPNEPFAIPSWLGFPFPDETAMTVVFKGNASSAAIRATLYDATLESTRFRIPTSGAFVVSFRDPVGFEPIAPREVSIPDERVVDVVIPLQRKE